LAPPFSPIGSLVSQRAVLELYQRIAWAWVTERAAAIPIRTIFKFTFMTFLSRLLGHLSQVGDMASTADVGVFGVRAADKILL